MSDGEIICKVLLMLSTSETPGLNVKLLSLGSYILFLLLMFFCRSSSFFNLQYRRFLHIFLTVIVTPLQKKFLKINWTKRNAVYIS